MLVSLMALVVASIANVERIGDAAQLTFGEPSTHVLALVGIATLGVYALLRRSFWRPARAADIRPMATSGAEPSQREAA